MSYSTFLYFKFFHKYILCHIENERRYTCQPVFLSILSIITEPMSLLSFVSLKHTPNSATLKKRATVTSLVVIRSNVLLICQWVFNLSEMVIFLMIYICCHFFFSFFPLGINRVLFIHECLTRFAIHISSPNPTFSHSYIILNLSWPSKTCHYPHFFSL